MTLSAHGVVLARTGRGLPVVMLHCLGADRRLWNAVAAELASQHEVLTYDLPGHGASPVPAAPYRLGDAAEQLAALLEREHVGACAVVGLSIGALIALEFALRYPARASRLVLADATPRYPPELQARWRLRAEAVRARGVGPLIPDILDAWFTRDALRRDVPGVGYARATLGDTSAEGYALACEALALADYDDALPAVRTPTLVLCGEHDAPAFRSGAERFARSIPHARLAWLPHVAHVAPLEDPGGFVDRVRGFLAPTPAHAAPEGIALQNVGGP